MRASEVLFRAADILENEGWCKGAYVRPPGVKPVTTYGPDILTLDGPRCAEGALMAALSVTSLLFHPAYTYITKEAGINTGITYWNDAQTDPSVVIDTLRFAGKRALEDEGAAA